MFRTSSITLANLKTLIEEKTVEFDNIPNSTVVMAVNNALEIYWKYERQLKPHRHTKNITINVPESGLELQSLGVSQLTQWVTLTNYVTGDIIQEAGKGYICVSPHTSALFVDDGVYWDEYIPLYSEEEGFYISRGTEFDQLNTISKMTEGVSMNCYYFLDDKLYLNPKTETEVTIKYFKQKPLFSMRIYDMEQTLPIVREANAFFEEFILQRFYRGDGMDQRETEATARFSEQLFALFGNTPLKAVYL